MPRRTARPPDPTPGTPPETPAERRARAVRLKVAGASYRQIAAELGVNARQATALFRQGLAEALGLDPEEYRRFNVMRCDRLIDRLMPVASRGDTDAARTIAILQAQQSKLLGLDQGPVGASGGELKVTIIGAPRPEARLPADDGD